MLEKGTLFKKGKNMKLKECLQESQSVTIPGSREGGQDIQVKKFANGLQIIQKGDFGMNMVFLTTTQLSSLIRMK